MTVKDFQSLVFNALLRQEEILHILESDASLLVSCTDESCFFIHIFESKQTFKHDSHAESLLNEYKVTYTKEKVAQELLDTVIEYPGFFLYFMVFTKLKEMGIIDSGLYYHILDMIVYYQHEFDDFIVGLLSHYRLDE